MKSLQALLALFACAFLPLHAASLDDLTYTTTDGKVTITDCKGSARGALVIPNSIDGNPVTSIGDFAFAYCGELTIMTIGNGVTSIGNRAFYNCADLASINIPDGVTSIGDDAFHTCYQLRSITIPDSVTSIGDYTFARCFSLTSITIPDSVTSIGYEAFYACDSLTSITIPDSVTSIGDFAFASCTRLTDIIFHGIAPTVGFDAFVRTPDGAVASVTIEALSSFGEVGSEWNGLTLGSTEAPPQSLEVQLAQMTAERDAAILERDARPNQESYDALIAALSLRPTQASFDAVKADRDARPTIGEVKDARLGSVVLQPDGANNNITIRFSIEETDDFRTWTKRDEINEITVP
ncbi:leucine-rich repeat domain-containing protein, partial [Akkermansiaceae bacterium]|nr:leucine-rich repeat domain-containing protein [Akkermansiaceae bacterium]